MRHKKGAVHLIVCLWLISLYFSVGKTSAHISSVQTIEDALNLLSIPHDLLATYVRVFLDYKNQGLFLIVRLITSIPFASYLLLFLSLVYYRYSKRYQFLLLLIGPLLIFSINILILAFALNMMSVEGAIQFASGFSRISFILSIIGALLTVVYWYYFESAFVESEICLDYNEDTRGELND